MQNADYSIITSMMKYLRSNAREIRLAKGRASQPEDEATDLEVTTMRGLVGKLNWATREGMLHGAGDANLLSATFPKPRVKHLLEANAALRRLLAADASITINSIPLDPL